MKRKIKSIVTLLMTAIMLVSCFQMSMFAGAADIKSAYKALISNYSSGYNYYYVYDIDKNGTPELIIEATDGFGGNTYSVYTYNGTSTVYIGKTEYYNCSLYECRGKNGVYCISSYMGNLDILKFSVSGGKLSVKTIVEMEDTSKFNKYSETKHPMKSKKCSDASLINSIGSKKPGKVNNLKASSVSDTKITLSWSKVTNADKYEVYYLKNGNYALYGTTSGTKLTVKNLSPNKSYKFKLRAQSGGGSDKKYGSYSDVLSAKTKALTKPGKVTGLTAKSKTSSSVKLSWKAVSGAQTYTVFKYNSSSKKYEKIASTSSTTYTVSKLKANTKYTFVVQAAKKVGGKTYTGSKSDKLSVKTNAETKKLTSSDIKKIYKDAYLVATKWCVSAEKYSTKDTKRIYNSEYNSYETYYRVTDSKIKTKAQLKKYLRKYFTESVVNNETRTYRDFDGKLYVSEFAYYVGPEETDLLSTMNVTVKSSSAGYCKAVIKMDTIQGSDWKSSRKFTVEFKKENGKWLIASCGHLPQGGWGKYNCYKL